MAPNGSLIVVHFVEPTPPNRRFKRTRLGWPLHITLVSWFSVVSEQKVIRALEVLARDYPAFKVTVGEEAWFGPDIDIAVNIIATQALCQALHNKLTQGLRTEGAVFASERWMNDNYCAHITHHGKRRRWAGDVETIDSIALVRLADQETCEVVRSFELGESYEIQA